MYHAPEIWTLRYLIVGISISDELSVWCARGRKFLRTLFRVIDWNCYIFLLYDYLGQSVHWFAKYLVNLKTLCSMNVGTTQMTTLAKNNALGPTKLTDRLQISANILHSFFFLKIKYANIFKILTLVLRRSVSLVRLSEYF